MPSILPMAILTLVASAALWGATLWAYSGRTWRYVALVPLGLPLSALVNLLVKGPLAKGVGELAGIEPGLGTATPLWFLVFLFLLAPVFEELIKVAPALIPSVRANLADRDSAFWTGMALGMGFGLGEAAYLAWGVATSGAYEAYPWYAFTGFLGERLFVVFFHALFTAVFLMLVSNRKPLLGYLAAAGAHALLNATAMLYQLKVVSAAVPGVSLLVLLVVGMLVFERLRPKTTKAVAERDEVVFYTKE